MVRRFSFQLNRRLSALTRRRVGLSLQDGELWAVEMLRPAGFSAGRGACARGGCSARRGNSGLGAGRFAVIHAGACGSIAVFCLQFTPVFFPLSGKKRRLAMSCVSIPPGRDRHSCVLAMSVWLSAFGRFTSGLCVSLWRSRRGYRGTGYGAGDVGFVHLCVITLALQCFPRGVRWGYAPPNLRQRVFDSLDSLHAAAGLCRRKFAALVRFCVITLALQCFPRGVRWG